MNNKIDEYVLACISCYQEHMKTSKAFPLFCLRRNLLYFAIFLKFLNILKRLLLKYSCLNKVMAAFLPAILYVRLYTNI